VVGEFFRHNTDVDVFVAEEPDFVKATSLLENKCREIGFTVKHCQPPRNKRPKFEVKAKETDKNDILSVVPAYRKDGRVEFRFVPHPAQYPDRMLQRLSRSICGHSFFSPPEECIKELFKTYVTNRHKLRTRQETWNNIRWDAEKILTPHEICELRIPRESKAG